MTVTEKHAEWISLLEVNGPFLAVTVLEDAFPQGLDRIDTPIRQRLRSAYEEWREAVDDSDPLLDALHREWVLLVLRDFLEYDASTLKSGDDLPASLTYHDPLSDVTFQPDFAIMAGNKAKLLITVTAPGARLDDPPPAGSWTASPAERMTLLCRSSGVPLGLVTDGERWMVVSAQSDGISSRATWYARLWWQEPVTLQAFYSLLGVRRCFGDERHTLEALVRESLEHQDEITDTLGEQVRRAVEVLVQALDRADLDRNRELLKGVTPARLYEAGLTVMMRLVFLLCAEERKLLLLGEPVYDQCYAVSTLRARLVEQSSHGLEILERRQDAWSRLLALFRGVYGGIAHENLLLPALGGSLFDPDRFPFLEGRTAGTSWQDTPAYPLPIDNRTVLLLLNALQVLEHRSGARLLSYESLDVEQIGHVYEGLLERTVKRVPEITLSLAASAAVRKKTGNPETPLSVLERQAQTGREALVEFLAEATGRSKLALGRDLASPPPPEAFNRLLLACGGDVELAERIRPFALLLRMDSWGDPLVYQENAFIVTLGAGRRETGTHYTPKSLTEPIVQHTLEPLVYAGPAEGWAREEWKLKSPDQMLALNVCDMAMGSGAFLVQACRWLGERLVEAWDAEEKASHPIPIDDIVLDKPDDTELRPRDYSERLLMAKRLVAGRCLYGVDINPMAVELAKLSLWLVTMMKNRPFSFLDHAFKCGDSLLGVSSIQQIENFSLRSGERQITFATGHLLRYVEEATAKRRALEDLPSNDHIQIETKNRLHAEAEAGTANVKAVADCLIALELRGLNDVAYEDLRTAEAEKVQLLLKCTLDASLKSQPLQINQISAHAREQLRGRRTFHWPAEFPEVFQRGGFDAFVGNPPFQGGLHLRGIVGRDYHVYLQSFHNNTHGNADYCAYMFLRTFALIRQPGTLGLLAVNTIAEGDTRQTGLEFIVKNGGSIYNAISRLRWPGAAQVQVSAIHIGKGVSSIPILDGKPVTFIDASLSEGNAEQQLPQRLKINSETSFVGSYISGDGFILTPEEKAEIVSSSSGESVVIFPFIGGSELNKRFLPEPRRYVINFYPKDEDEAAKYPICFKRAETLVKPHRAQVKRERRSRVWWLFADQQIGLYESVRRRRLERVLGVTMTVMQFKFDWIPSNYVYDQTVVVLLLDRDEHFALVNSSIHLEWAYKHGASFGSVAAPRYNPSRCFETFPMPIKIHDLSVIGRDYHSARGRIMLERQEGLTKTYNRFHDRCEQSTDIAQLRALHVEMDQAVAAAYGWGDLDLGHGFYATKQGERFTLSEPARREVLHRLLTLNHQRHTEEIATGLQKKFPNKSKNKKIRNVANGENDSGIKQQSLILE